MGYPPAGSGGGGGGNGATTSNTQQQSTWQKAKSWLCSKIGSNKPFVATLDDNGDFQFILLPGVGGGTGVGITSNGQVFVEFTAQGELGELTNMSIGLTTSIGRTTGNLPVRQPSTEGYVGGQGAYGVGAVASVGWQHSSSGGSFSKDFFLGGGFAAQAAATAGTTTRIALNSPLCGS